MPANTRTKLSALMELAMSSLQHDEFMEKFRQLLDEARLEERRRACRLVLEFEVYSPYITEKHFIQERKDRLVELIMDGMK